MKEKVYFSLVLGVPIHDQELLLASSRGAGWQRQEVCGGASAYLSAKKQKRKKKGPGSHILFKVMPPVA